RAVRLSSFQPDVPMTVCSPFLIANSTTWDETSGTVRSRTWVAPATLISYSEFFEESLATSSISLAVLTTSMAYCPILPVAPTKATLMGSCADSFSEDIWPSLVNVVGAAFTAAIGLVSNGKTPDQMLCSVRRFVLSEGFSLLHLLRR